MLFNNNKDLSIWKLLVAHGATIDSTDIWERIALYVAAEWLKICQFLVSKGALTDDKEIWNITFLHQAVVNGNLPVFQLLVSKCIKPLIFLLYQSIDSQNFVRAHTM